MFLSDPLDCNSSDVIDFVFWSFCKLDADRAPKFVAAPITAKHQNTNFNGSIRHGYFDDIEIAMTGMMNILVKIIQITSSFVCLHGTKYLDLDCDLDHDLDNFAPCKRAIRLAVAIARATST